MVNNIKIELIANLSAIAMLIAKQYGLDSTQVEKLTLKDLFEYIETGIIKSLEV